MTQLATLTARYTRRPLLLLPQAAEDIIARLQPGQREVRSVGFVEAALRKIGLGRPVAMDDEDPSPDAAPQKPACYTPLWAQESMGEPEDEGFCWSLYQGIALMEIANALTDRGEYYCGTWYHGYDSILAGLKTASADDRVKALFISVNTPGGVVAPGLTELAAWIRDNRAAAGGKPIWFWCSMSCSAGEWITSQGDRKYAGRHSLIGSIGAAYVHYDMSEAYAQAGVKVMPIIFGAEKMAGAQWAPLSDTAQADLQSEIDQVGRDFVADMVLGRPQLTAEALIATQARVYLGQNEDPTRSALAIGLIDGVMTEQACFEALLASISETSSPPSAGLSGPTASSPQKETPMVTTPKAAGGKPVAKAQPRAENNKPATEAEDGGVGDDGEGEGDAPPADPEAPIEEPEAEADGEEAKAAAEARKISGSAEAQTHPKLALAAILSGQTYAQFKASAAASAAEAAGARKSSALADAMAGVKRVGADASEGGQKGLGDLLISASSKVR